MIHFKLKYLLSLLILLVVACKSNDKPKDAPKPVDESLKAKELFQGVWIDEETNNPFLLVRDDSIYYADNKILPSRFYIDKSKLSVIGNDTTSYYIDKQSKNSFWFHTLSDNTVKLRKSLDSLDLEEFTPQEAMKPIATVHEVIKKDSVVHYKGIRYRAYVYVNPSTMKVIKTAYSPEGMSINQVYYDNIIHICVYQGTQRIYGKDITKKLFSNIIEKSVLDTFILADIQFVGVSTQGFHYQAIVGIPESYRYNVVNMYISFDGNLTFELQDTEE